MKLSRRSFLGRSASGVSALSLLAPSTPYLSATSEAASTREHKFVTVDGIRTRYFEAGSGEAMVLVHGGHFGMSISSANDWMPIFLSLAAHFHVYAVDKLGMGLTGNPRSDSGYTMQATVQHIYRFLEELGIESVHLVGHSRGGLPVARIAIDHPEMVKTLTIFDSNTLAPGDPAPSSPNVAPPGPPPTQESIRNELLAAPWSLQKDYITDEYVEGQLEVALQPKIREAAEKLELLRKSFVERNPEKVKARPALARNSGTGWWMYKTKDETLALIKAGRLKKPTLIIWGFNDPSAPPNLGLDLFELIRKSVGRAHLHYLNECGHAPHEEYPLEVTDLMVNFIKFSKNYSKN